MNQTCVHFQENAADDGPGQAGVSSSTAFASDSTVSAGLDVSACPDASAALPAPAKPSSPAKRLFARDTFVVRGFAGTTDALESARVCRDAGIARATFYEYFQDVFAVATWMWDHLMGSTLYQMGRTLDCYTAHVRKFEVLREHREFFENAMRIVDYASICQHGGRMMHEHIEGEFERKAGRALTECEALWLEFFVTGAKHMTRHWVERGMVEDPVEMAELFAGNVPAFLVPYLEPDGSPGDAP